MVTGIYIWFDYTKPSGSSASHIDWAGTIDIDRAKKAVDKITAEDMLRAQHSRFFSHNVTLSISIQEIKTGKILYKKWIL